MACVALGCPWGDDLWLYMGLLWQEEEVSGEWAASPLLTAPETPPLRVRALGSLGHSCGLAFTL